MAKKTFIISALSCAALLAFTGTVSAHEKRGGNGNNNGNGNLGSGNGNNNGNNNLGNLNGNNNGNFNYGWSNGNSNGNNNLKRDPWGAYKRDVEKDGDDDQNRYGSVNNRNNNFERGWYVLVDGKYIRA